MYSGNKVNGFGGYPSTFRSSGQRLWGMSHSLPSGMSNYAYNYKQDADFTYTRTRMFDIPSSNNFGRPGSGFGGHSRGPMLGRATSSSTSSLVGIGTSGGGAVGAGFSLPTTASGDVDKSKTNLIVNYIPQDMAERELFGLFTPFGPIESCKIMRDLKTGYSYGFGFINYVNEDSARRAIECLNGFTIRNKRLKVSLARPPGEDIKETNLYITNLPRNITEEWLETIFGKYGTIVQKNILRDKLSGSPRGVAFVRYNKREEAQEAISALHNVIPQGGTQPLQVRVAEDHGRAKAALYLPSINAPFLHNRGRNRMRPY